MPAADEAFADLRWRLERERDFVVVAATALAGGYNNRLFRLTAADERVALAKFYYRDDRRRLERETTMLNFLERHGFTEVPRVWLTSPAHDYAVHSFEPGVLKPAADWTVEDVASMARFLAALHAFRPDTVDIEFPAAVGSALGLAAEVALIESRLAAFAEAAAAPDADASVRVLATVDNLPDRIHVVARHILASATAEQRATLPRGAWRLGSSDFAPHNVLFGPAGSFLVLDFEYSGWDDPARVVLGFILHDQATDLAPELAAHFFATYRDLADLDDAAIAHFERARQLLDLEWVTIYLSGVTPARLANRAFSNPKFDRAAHIAERLEKARRRLIRIEREFTST